MDKSVVVENTGRLRLVRGGRPRHGAPAVRPGSRRPRRATPSPGLRSCSPVPRAPPSFDRTTRFPDAAGIRRSPDGPATRRSSDIQTARAEVPGAKPCGRRPRPASSPRKALGTTARPGVGHATAARPGPDHGDISPGYEPTTRTSAPAPDPTPSTSVLARTAPRVSATRPDPKSEYLRASSHPGPHQAAPLEARNGKTAAIGIR